MPDTKITLFAVSPIKANGKRVYQTTFEVDTQEDADALIKCGAATLPDDGVADALAEAEQAEAERLAAEEAERVEAERLAAEEAERIEAERIAAEQKDDSNVVELFQSPATPEERLAAIKTATETLKTEGDAEKFTAAKGPTVDALTTVLRWKPTSAERNQVWMELSAPAVES